MSKEIDVGFTYSFASKVTDETVRKFADVSGDHNPIHLDDEYAKTTRFGKRIAHGMIVGGFISRVLNEGLGGGGIYLSQSLKFTSPVFINDTITINLKVTALRKERGLASVETNAVNQDGVTVVKGEAMIMLAGAPSMK